MKVFISPRLVLFLKLDGNTLLIKPSILIPEELSQIFEEFYEEDELNVHINKAEYSENIFTVSFTLKSIATTDINTNNKKWMIRTIGHRRNRVSFDSGTKIRIEDDHPLLWEYTDIQCELYFNGQGSDSAKLHFELYKLHVGLFENYIPLEAYFNSWYSYDLLEAKNGLLARGPKKLLSQYAECLKNHNVDFSMIDNKFIPEKSNLLVLFIDATDTYIIAEDFEFLRSTC